MSRRPRESKPTEYPTDPAYIAYLHSTQWKAKRKRIVAERGARCEVCGETGGRLSLHHLTYVRLYDELDSDLVVTCEQCHAGLHGNWRAVRAIGARKEEHRVKVLVALWKDSRRPPSASQASPVESNEWRGYDPFANAADPAPSWLSPKTATPSLKERF